MITSAIGIPLALFLIVLPSPYPLAAVVALLAVGGFLELARALKMNTFGRLRGILGCLAFAALSLWETRSWGTGICNVFGLLSASTLIDMFSEPEACYERPDLLYRRIFAVFYPGLLFSFLIRLRMLPGPEARLGSLVIGIGSWLLLLLFLILWASDSAAFLVGRKWGKHKMAPVISPGKSWEGAIAALAAGGCMGWLVFVFTEINPVYGIATGVVLAIAGMLGDFAESGVKRRLGVKDLGGILPGHGGIMDRFDSALFAGPALYFLFKLSHLR